MISETATSPERVERRERERQKELESDIELSSTEASDANDR
jgi:hypothetical protein